MPTRLRRLCKRTYSTTKASEPLGRKPGTLANAATPCQHCPLGFHSAEPSTIGCRQTPAAQPRVPKLSGLRRSRCWACARTGQPLRDHCGAWWNAPTSNGVGVRTAMHAQFARLRASDPNLLGFVFRNPCAAGLWEHKEGQATPRSWVLRCTSGSSTTA